MKIAITDYSFPSLDIEESIFKSLGHEIAAWREKKTAAELPTLVADADAVITQFAPVNADVIASMQRAKVIVRYGIGVDNVDLEAAKARGIPVCNVPDYCIDEVADHTLAFILGTTRKVVPNTLHVRDGKWGLATPLDQLQTLCDQTVGIVGFGRIGREVAARLAPFKSRQLVFDAFVPPEVLRNAGCEPVSLDDLLSQSDIVTLHCPSTPQTKKLLNATSIARKWIARIMISWGLVSCCTMFVTDQWTFYGLRILLGVAEAGFFPGIILYLSYWFPAQQRAKMTAFFMVAIGLSSVFGNPVSGAIMQYLDTVRGMHGWQWLFLLEGMPSVALGFVTLAYLTDYPKDAAWLSTEEREWLIDRMHREEEQRRQRRNADRLGAILQWRVWLLIAIYFTVAVGSNAGGAYFPKLIEAQFTTASTFQIGLLSALPPLCSVLGMTLFGISSDRRNERKGHLAAAALMAAIGWSLTAWAPSPVVAFAGLCIAQTGMMSMLPVFWTLPTAFLTGAAAAGGIAMINSVGNIGGFLGANILGSFGLWSMAGILFVGAVLVIGVPNDSTDKEA